LGLSFEEYAMKKALVPMIISLALCGAATTALVAGSAHAQAARNPMMVAMVTSNNPFAITPVMPPGDGGTPPRGPQGRNMLSPADMAAMHKRMCQDAYAHQVGDLAYLEAKLSLSAAQQPLFDHWKSVKLDIAKRGEADCATRELPRDRARNTLLDEMTRQEDMLKRRLTDLQAERPVLTAFYNALNDTQKAALMHPGPEAMMGRHLMFSDALRPPMPNGGMMGPGPGLPQRGQGMGPDGPQP
jgi:LTXXQ motif family protein